VILLGEMKLASLIPLRKRPMNPSSQELPTAG
jgi:hypothetical protein